MQSPKLKFLLSLAATIQVALVGRATSWSMARPCFLATNFPLKYWIINPDQIKQIDNILAVISSLRLVEQITFGSINTGHCRVRHYN